MTNYERTAAWRRRNRPLLAEQLRRYREKHRERLLVASRLKYLANRERILEQQADYRSRHAADYRRRATAWNRANPDRRRAIVATSKAKRDAASGSYTTAEWLALVAEWSGWCAYCGMSGPLSPDHRIPLSRGGTSDITNIIPACHSCNYRKHAKTEAEYRRLRLREVA